MMCSKSKGNSKGEQLFQDINLGDYCSMKHRRGKGGAAGAAAPLVIASAPPGEGLWWWTIINIEKKM